MGGFRNTTENIDRTVVHDCDRDHVVLDEDGRSRVVVSASKETFRWWRELPEITLLFKRSSLYVRGKTLEVSVESVSGKFLRWR